MYRSRHGRDTRRWQSCGRILGSTFMPRWHLIRMERPTRQCLLQAGTARLRAVGVERCSLPSGGHHQIRSSALCQSVLAGFA